MASCFRHQDGCKRRRRQGGRLRVRGAGSALLDELAATACGRLNAAALAPVASNGADDLLELGAGRAVAGRVGKRVGHGEGRGNELYLLAPLQSQTILDAPIAKRCAVRMDDELLDAFRNRAG